MAVSKRKLKCCQRENGHNNSRFICEATVSLAASEEAQWNVGQYTKLGNYLTDFSHGG